nr:site-specific DNA-methyltransferase [Mesorhizobium sp. WSM4875]
MIHREKVIGGCRLILGDCVEIIPKLGKFNCAITSPPYDKIRDYGSDWQGVDCLKVISLLSDGLSAGGVVVWNVSDQTIDGSETGSSFRHALHAMDAGLRLHDTMIYCKEGVTFPDKDRYHPAFEYMFVFSKESPRHFNGIRDWTNKWAGAPMGGTRRQKDGSTKPISGAGKIIPNQGLRRNWWVIANAYTGDTAGHPAPMPYRLASDHIETWTTVGELVVDPFMGSGTTGVACVRLGRRFVGIEINETYFDLACERLQRASAEPDLFALTRAAEPEQQDLL